MSGSPRNLSSDDKALYLKALPNGVSRVQVRDVKGKNCWRKLDMVVSSDTLMFDSEGNPVVMKGEPGRRPRVTLAPVGEGAAEIMEAKADHLREDPLLAAVVADPAGDKVLDLLMQEMTKEASSLEWERKEAERHNADTSGLSVKRARILASVSEVYIKRREKLADAAFDLDTPYAQAFIMFLLETFKEVMQDTGVRTEHIETMFTKLSKKLDDGWKAEAKARMREAKP